MPKHNELSQGIVLAKRCEVKQHNGRSGIQMHIRCLVLHIGMYRCHVNFFSFNGV